MMMWVIFLMIAWRVNGFLLFLHADGNTDNFLVNTNNANNTNVPRLRGKGLEDTRFFL